MVHDGSIIFAAASARVPADRQIVRFSGAGVARVIERLIEGGDEVVRQGRGARGVWCKLGEAGRVPAIAIYMPGRLTYTGEESFELIVPGSMTLGAMISRRVLELCDEQGRALVRPAQAGEFSSRALANGRIKPEQLEGIAMLLSAASAAEHHAGMKLLQGEFGGLIDACTQRLIRVITLLEAGIDFSDQEDVSPLGVDELMREMAWIRGQLEVIGEQGGPWMREVTREGGVPTVMLVGLPNAGKSTLMNAMIDVCGEPDVGERARSVTSEIAGTTRDLLTARLAIKQQRGAVMIELIDAPGIDEAGEHAQEAAGLSAMIRRRTLEAMGRADVLVVCSAVGAFDELLREAQAAAKPGAVRILVRTKADRPMVAGNVTRVGSEDVTKADVEVCALTGLGVARLLEVIGERLSMGMGSIWPERLVQGFAEATAHLAEAHRQIEADGQARETRDRRLRSMEVLAHHLRRAHDSLAQIHGPLQADAILGRIFSSFCIGK